MEVSGEYIFVITNIHHISRKSKFMSQKYDLAHISEEILNNLNNF